MQLLRVKSEESVMAATEEGDSASGDGSTAAEGAVGEAIGAVAGAVAEAAVVAVVADVEEGDAEEGGGLGGWGGRFWGRGGRGGGGRAGQLALVWFPHVMPASWRGRQRRVAIRPVHQGRQRIGRSVC